VSSPCTTHKIFGKTSQRSHSKCQRTKYAVRYDRARRKPVQKRSSR
jgi:hypothetical protein